VTAGFLFITPVSFNYLLIFKTNMTTEISVTNRPDQLKITLNEEKLGLANAEKLAREYVTVHPKERHNLGRIALSLHGIEDRLGYTLLPADKILHFGQILTRDNELVCPKIFDGDTAIILRRGLPLITVTRLNNK